MSHQRADILYKFFTLFTRFFDFPGLQFNQENKDGSYTGSVSDAQWGNIQVQAVIQNAASMLRERGARNFYIDAGGEIAVVGHKDDKPWRVGIRNPFNRTENVKVLALSERRGATSS